MSPGQREEWHSARIAAAALWRGWWRALRRRDGTARGIWPHLIEAWQAVVWLGRRDRSEGEEMNANEREAGLTGGGGHA